MKGCVICKNKIKQSQTFCEKCLHLEYGRALSAKIRKGLKQKIKQRKTMTDETLNEEVTPEEETTEDTPAEETETPAE